MDATDPATIEIARLREDRDRWREQYVQAREQTDRLREDIEKMESRILSAAVEMMRMAGWRAVVLYQTLVYTEGNIAKAAHLLDWSRSTTRDEFNRWEKSANLYHRKMYTKLTSIAAAALNEDKAESYLDGNGYGLAGASANDTTRDAREAEATEAADDTETGAAVRDDAEERASRQ